MEMTGIAAPVVHPPAAVGRHRAGGRAHVPQFGPSILCDLDHGRALGLRTALVLVRAVVRAVVRADVREVVHEVVLTVVRAVVRAVVTFTFTISWRREFESIAYPLPSQRAAADSF